MHNVVLIRSNPVKPYPRLEKMANCLAKNGHGVTVLAWDRDEDYSPREEELKLKDTTVKIVRIGIKGQFSGGIKKNLKGLLKFQSFIYSWLKKHKKEYDVIHAYDFDTGFTAAKCAKAFGKKLVYDIPDYYVDSHDMKGTKIGNVVEKLEIGVINKADATIICTEERKVQIAKATPKKIVVVHNTPNLDVPEMPDSQNRSEKLKLVYVGILGRSRFIDKIAEVVSKRNDCEFHIGGFGGNMEGYFSEMAEKYENIFYYGRISYDKTIALENECDIMCALYDPAVPNHYFAAPNKFYEALMLGKPLIMAKNTGMAAVVEEYGIGEVIEYSTEALNKAIDSLIERKAEFEEISRKCQKLYREMYSWDKMEEKIYQLYENL